MTTYASDTFTRVDSATTLGTAETGGAWTAHAGTWGINTNRGMCVTPAAGYNRASLSVAQADVEVSTGVRLSPTTNRAAAGLLLRWADTNNHLELFLFKVVAGTGVPDNIELRQRVGGVFSVLGSVTSAGLVEGNTYNLKAVIWGTTIAVYLDSVLKIAATSFNAGLTTQKYGLNSYSDIAGGAWDDGLTVWDDFLITDVASAFTGYPRPQQAVYRM